MQPHNAKSEGRSFANSPNSVRRVLVMVNPHSRRGDTDLGAVLAMLESAGIEVRRESPDSAEEIERILAAQCSEVDLVLVAGGDGTLHSAVPAVVRHQKPMAILPLGTANDMARSLGIPEDLQAAGQVILDGRQKKVDLGRVNGEYFINAVNIGLGTEITHRLTEEVKKTWGVLSYLKALWEALARKNAFRAEIVVDGRRYRQRSIHLTIGNGRFYGGGNVVDEAATIDSGVLYLYSLKPQPLWKLMVLAPLLRLGKQGLADRTFTRTGRRIEIRASRQLEVHADGERVSHTPAVLEVIPGALTVLVPLED
ncbi:lipid kinase [Gilvimarinus sp. F26214L]|uniref:lipid kinase n=1 Tax=Gilvimarinus sp. DZF01 TaxID=3461371 RepID=UPI004045AA02